MPNILLDGKSYFLRSPLRMMNLSEWGTVLRTTAEQKRSDRAAASDWVIESLTGGLGQKFGLGSGERFWFGDAWTLHPGKIMLPPLQQDALATGYTGVNADGNLYFMRWLKGELYIAGDNYLKKYKKSDNTWTDCSWAFTGGFNPWDGLTFWDGTNERIVISFSTDAGAARIIHSTTGAAASWTNVAVGSGTGRPWMAVFDGKLCVYTSQGYFSYTTDLVNWTSFQATPLPSWGWYGENSGRGIGVWIDASGKRAPYIATVSKVYVVDIYAQIVQEAAGMTDAIIPWEYNAGAFHAIGSYFYIGGQGTLWRLSTSTVSEIGPWQGDGLDSSVIPNTARITDILPWGDDILIAVYCVTGYSAILCFTGSGWHVVAISSQNMLTYSEQFDNAAWTDPLNRITQTANNATDPLGTTTADTVKWDTASGYLRQVVTLTNGATYTFSIYARLSNDVSGGVLSIDAGDGTAVSFTATSTLTRYQVTLVAGTSDWIDILHAGTSGFEFWGAQLELASQASPYVQTVAAAVTAGIIRMAWEIDSASYAATRRLYYTSGVNVRYMDMPRLSYDLTTISGFKYAASAYLYTPYWGENLSELGAGIFKLYTRGLLFTANETLTVLYAINYVDGTETSLGSIAANSGTLTYASGVGIEAETLRYKLTLARGTTNTLTPVLLFANTKVLKQAESKFAWEATIDLDKSADTDRDAETIRAELEGLFGAKTNTVLQYAGKTKYVQILGLVATIDPGGDKGTTGYDVSGSVVIRMAEVV